MPVLDANQAGQMERKFGLHDAATQQFSLKCCCGAQGPDDLQDALAEGWVNIDYDESGSAHDFVGYCPDCR